jgi:hypothetical protein
MMKKETLNRYANVINNCPSYDDVEFVIEKMFNLYVPTKGEIKQFLYENYEIGSDDYYEFERKLLPLISKLFQDRFDRLDSELDK